MIILTLRNNVKNPTNLEVGMSLAQQLCSTIGLTLQFKVKDTSKKFTSVGFTNESNNNGFVIASQEIFDEAKSFNTSFDVALLVFDWTKVTPNKPTNPACVGMNIQIPEEWCGIPLDPNVFAEFFLHELCHHFFQGQNKKDTTHDYIPEFSQRTRTDYYLYLLKDLIKSTMPIQPTYKYFKLTEKTGTTGTIKDLKPELVQMLDRARGYAGIPFVLNSGYRTEAKNEDVGGVEDSSHLSREAVDIRARNSNEHFLITKGLIMAGFTRISKKYANHIHVDIDKDKPQNVLF